MIELGSLYPWVIMHFVIILFITGQQGQSHRALPEIPLPLEGR
jgi:hypothetical protein